MPQFPSCGPERLAHAYLCHTLAHTGERHAAQIDSRNYQKNGNDKRIAHNNSLSIGYFTPLTIKIGKQFIGLPPVEHFRVAQPIVVLTPELLHLLTDSRKIGCGICKNDCPHLPHSIFPPRQPGDIRRIIRYPHLCIGRSGKHRHICHYAGYTVFHMIQQHCLSRYIRRSEQAACHRRAQHSAWHSCVTIGLRKCLSAEKTEMENMPECIICLNHIDSGLVACR